MKSNKTPKVLHSVVEPVRPGNVNLDELSQVYKFRCQQPTA